MKWSILKVSKETKSVLVLSETHITPADPLNHASLQHVFLKVRMHWQHSN